MPDIPDLAGLRQAIERYVAAAWTGPPIVCGNRRIRTPADGRWVRLTVEPDRGVAACHAPRGAGAGAALALAERVTAVLRASAPASLRFGTPSVDLDGRNPDGFCAVVILPIRQGRLEMPSAQRRAFRSPLPGRPPCPTPPRPTSPPRMPPGRRGCRTGS